MYKDLAFGKELCVVPEDILNFLNNKILSCKESWVPDLETGSYRQWNLQKETIWYRKREASSHWITNDCFILDNFFRKFVKEIFRFRLSELDTNGKLDWHIRHKYPRIHIPLNGSYSEFVIKDSLELSETVIPMHYGKAYVINVTLPHSVKQTTSTRHNAFFSFEQFHDGKYTF